MTKKLLLACLVGALSVSSAYADCPGGGEEIGDFCVPYLLLNWWSAASWCEANGMSLATILDVCPHWTGKMDEYSDDGTGCNDVYNNRNKWAWTATAYDDVNAIVIKERKVAMEYRSGKAYFVCKKNP